MVMEDIVNKYSLYIYGAIKNMSKGMLENEDIEELVTDTFFILWKNKDRFIQRKRYKTVFNRYCKKSNKRMSKKEKIQ